MVIDLQPVSLADKNTLRSMFSPYLKELFHSEDMEEDDPFFDRYWIDEDRWPYFIIKDKTIAGFALINTWSPSGKGTDYSVAEFYVLPEHRAGGIGKHAFTKLLKLHSGVWEINVMKDNAAGMRFWEKVIQVTGKVSIEKIALESDVVFRLSSH
ncbi:GNAT family N-acetyltransferase [Serratia sp. M24T3]|uniref:GNAT family N-acetyltransferase n=1 Tax=Serratia sp. M24T3 TaxID=932213 RepID=UPI00025BB1D7|nr:GNAT family N-acetyltransferase [Serratia sp. M24T3]EIC83580.1 acetyltransferase [Serratia sp. M24T3]